MLKVGLTGGIGAGKSTVAGVLGGLGAAVIDADAIAREVVEPGTDGLRALVEEFGAEILAPDSSLDRPALARVAFADEDSRLRLNAILHPRIGARTQEYVEAAGETIVVQDIPLLVEGGMAPLFHLVIVVDADVGTRVARLVGGRGLDEADARARINAQAATDQRRAAADVWMDNSGAPGALDAEIEQLWTERLVPFRRNLTEGAAAIPNADACVAANADGAAEQARRLAERIRAALGADAHAVEPEPAGNESTVTVRLAEHVGGASVAQRLVRAGLVPSGGNGYVSADPGAPARVAVRP